ncbi:MAG: hypothetical protein CVV49_14120 [Spirochaetae bacterium HGW-Spirochaetae-5]|nr:MAG: hypothetical protein CVV49_14120 [Spirochaetae bacterium HGW-Spirochaetae-5]
MKKTISIISIFIISLVFINCSKKDQGKLAAEQFKLSENASVNSEINKLKDTLKTAGTDVEKAEINTKIAVILDEKGDINSLMKTAAEAVKYQPNQYMSRYLLGKSYIAVGRYNDAVDELNISIGLKGDFAPAYFELGNAQYKKFSYPAAKESYKKAIAYDKKMIDAYNNLGVLSTLTNDLKSAETYLKTCNSLNPDFAVAYKNLGILYDTKMKKGPEAIENYNKYLTLRPDCPERSLVKLWISAIGG